MDSGERQTFETCHSGYRANSFVLGTAVINTHITAHIGDDFILACADRKGLAGFRTALRMCVYIYV